MGPKIYQGYVVLLLVTTPSKFQIFATIFAHIATPINAICLEPLWLSCGYGAKRIAPFCLDYHLDLSFATHVAALLKPEAVQYFFYLHSATFQFCWIWCVKLALNGPNKAKTGPQMVQNSQFSASNSVKLERNGVNIKQYLNCFKLQQSGFVYSKT